MKYLYLFLLHYIFYIPFILYAEQVNIFVKQDKNKIFKYEKNQQKLLYDSSKKQLSEIKLTPKNQYISAIEKTEGVYESGHWIIEKKERIYKSGRS